MKVLVLLQRIGIVAAGLSVLVLTGCGRDDPSTQEASTSQQSGPRSAQGSAASPDALSSGGRKLKLSSDEIRSAGIKTAVLREEEVSEQLTVTATIRPNQDRIVHVAPRVTGRIVKVQVNLGDAVRTGQTLAVLDSLEVGEAHSAYLQAKTVQAVAKADFERAELLYGEQIIAKKDHLRAHAEYEKSKAAFAAAADRLRMLGVSQGPSADGRAVSTFPLLSPVTGTVIEKHAILGELAQPDKQLFVVADLSRLWIEANLFEKDLSRVQLGAPAIVTVAAYPDEAFQGRLTYIAAVVDKETRTVQARVEVANSDGHLKPEMFATAAIQTSGGKRQKALLLPEEAVVLMQGQLTVFIEESSGSFEPRAVELGEKLRGRVVLKKGLAVGDRVVTEGTFSLKARLMKAQLGEGH
ncbi:efflux RND transporter periplasmic adaptor subunit [Cupriavidus alkaliphilus]|uniref:efflux RND transporter periplasmic adaptor subunit n=1 Tax=Cupriavidus alkaliphilus TaxID=942866 RepID=UPI00339D84D7